MEKRLGPICRKKRDISHVYVRSFFKNVPIPASFSFILGLFKQTLQFLQQMYVKNVHPVYGAGIRTHDIQNVCLFP